MNRRIVLLLVFTAALATTVGCHRGWLCDDCGPYSCGPCGGGCRPCGDYCDTACDPCGGPCGGRCFRPIAWVLDLFRPIELNGCGCGRCAYRGDFCGDPPDDCDPCDRCGNWTGRPGCSHCGSHSAAGADGGDEIIEGEQTGPAPAPQPAPHKAQRSSQSNRTTRTGYYTSRTGYYQ